MVWDLNVLQQKHTQRARQEFTHFRREKPYFIVNLMVEKKNIISLIHGWLVNSCYGHVYMYIYV